MRLSGLVSRAKEWLWPPPSAWEDGKAWAGRTDGEFHSRNRAGRGSRGVEAEGRSRCRCQVWHWGVEVLSSHVLGSPVQER